MPFMPLIVKPSSWLQSESTVTLKIPSYGFQTQNIDIFVTEKYVKAHYGQYFFEIFLWGLIDPQKSSCTVTSNEIIFELQKWANNETWENLEANLDKSQKRELRQQIIEESQKKNQKIAEQKVVKNAELKRTAVREQINLDSKKFEWIKSVKENDKLKALKDLDLLEINDKNPQKENPVPEKTDFKKSNDISKHKSSKKKISPKIFEPKICLDEPKANSIPMPRKCQTLNVTFTEREFPTPSRESMAQEEQDWLQKQAAARRSAGFSKEDLRPEERNPQWLKAKGDQFFRDKNYLGAISAYSEGIKISKDFVDLYIKRSAAHFEIGNMQKTIEDCSSALDIMKPAVPSNLSMRAKCIARRAAALCAIGLSKQGVQEFDIAIELVRKKDDSLRVDIERMKQKCLERQEQAK